MEKHGIPLWAKIVLVMAMIGGSDPTSEPVINTMIAFHMGEQISFNLTGE